MKPQQRIDLQNLKQRDRARNVPSISEEVAQFIYNLICRNKPQKVLEIGCAHAYSSIWIGRALEAFGGHLTTLDHSLPSFAIAQENINQAGLKNTIDVHFGAAEKLIPQFNQTYDLIFIDGVKKSTLNFFNCCAPLLNNGGMIIVDDVLKFRHKMKNFWDFMESQNEWTYEVHPLDEDDGIMVVKKTA